MFGFSPTVWFIVQIALAAGGIVAWIALVLPSISKLPEKRLLLDVWGPIAIVMPALFAISSVDVSVAEDAGRYALGGPMLIAMIAFGIALMRIRLARAESSEPLQLFGFFPPVVWTVTAIIVLLLCAADVLTVLVGQCVFAAAAVVLWISTPMAGDKDAAPRETSHAGSETRRAEARAIIGTLIVTALAIAQGVALLGGESAVRGSQVGLVYALVILVASAIVASPADGMRLAGWSGALATAFGIGLLSLLHMLPTALRSLPIGGPAEALVVTPSLQVANGFSALAPESTGLLAIGLAGLTVERIGPLGRKIAGVMLVFAACCLLLWKLL